MPRVSVIIPSYNHEKYVAEAIQSVFDQTYQDFEIVITDDFSVDKTVDAIKGFTDPRIRLFCFSENRGVGATLNHCIREAQGEYIAVLNSDDVFLKGKLEKQVLFLETHPNIAAVFTYGQIVDEEGNSFIEAAVHFDKIFNQPIRTRFKKLRHSFYDGGSLYHSSVLIHKKYYEKINFYDERLAQTGDFDCWIRLLMEFDIYVMPEILMQYRIRSFQANASGDRPEPRKRRLLERVHILKNFLRIKTKEDFFKIFPEASQYHENFSERLIPYYIARLALDKGGVEYVAFAVLTLFELMNDSEIQKEIYGKYHFSLADFIMVTGQYDVFNTELLRGKISELEHTNERLNEAQDKIRELQNSLEVVAAESRVVQKNILWHVPMRICRTIDYIFSVLLKRRLLITKLIKKRSIR